jgi:Domain of unknown function (DUF4439)
VTARPTPRRSTPGRAGGPAGVAALQAALGAENSAVYGYGVAGAHLAGPRRAAAVRNWVAHQAARDTLTAMLAAREAQPVAAAAAYELPFDVRNAAAAVALAIVLEDRLSAAYLGLVGLSDPALRAFGARAVRAAALRAAAWRGSTLAFPGLDVPAPRRPGPATAGRGTTAPTSPPPGSPTPSHPGG